MHKTIIVDDEWMIRDGLAGRLADLDAALEIDCAGSFADGFEALAYLEDNEADILLTDIQMPGMDGLELVRAVKHKAPGMRIVLITGHAEFEYARQALQLGADDYLLKPIGRAQLRDVMERAVAKLQEQHAALRDKREQLLFRAIHSSSKEDWSASFRELGFPGKQPAAFRMLIVRNYDAANARTGEADERIDRFLEKQPNAVGIRDFDTEDDWAFLFADSQGQDWMRFADDLLREADGGDGSDGDADKPERLNEANGAGERSGGDDGASSSGMRVGISSACPGRPDVAAMLQEARVALNGRFRSPHRRKLFYEPGSEAAGTGDVPFRHLLQAFEQSLHQRTKERVAGHAGPLLRQLWHSPEMAEASYESREAVFYSCMTKMEQYAASRHLLAARDKAAAAIRERMFDRFLRFEEAAAFTERLLQDALGEGTELGAFQSGVMSELRAYIERHFDEGVTLQQLADRFHLNAHYLSSLFKKELGTPFSEFLSGRRIEKAKELLRSTDLKHVDIALSTGFNDQQYFCRVFKKRVGQTPAEYRKQSRAGK